jgi:RNA polymerase sigma factor (sigma-70 family)
VNLEAKQAFVEALAAEHGERLRQFLHTRVRNAADIPDIIQEVYLRLLRVPNYETIRTPEAYIFTIAHHVAQQHALRAVTRVAGAVELDEVLPDMHPAADGDPALEVSAQQCLLELDQVLDELPPKQQAAFLFYRRDGLSLDEISARLGISRQMAKKYLAKALVKFRKRLKEIE